MTPVDCGNLHTYNVVPGTTTKNVKPRDILETSRDDSK